MAPPTGPSLTRYFNLGGGPFSWHNLLHSLQHIICYDHDTVSAVLIIIHYLNNICSPYIYKNYIRNYRIGYSGGSGGSVCKSSAEDKMHLTLTNLCLEQCLLNEPCTRHKLPSKSLCEMKCCQEYNLGKKRNSRKKGDNSAEACF